MALLTFADLRPDSLAEFAAGCDVGPEVPGATDANLTAAIERMTQRFQGWVNDTFVQFEDTLDLDGMGGDRLVLPHRTTEVAEISLRGSSGALTIQDSDAYRLHSSLNVSGDRAVGVYDWLEVVGFPAVGLDLVDVGWSPYYWPTGPRTVRVIGTFGWTVPEPDAARAVAMMVWDHFKPMRQDLGRAQSWNSTDVSIVQAVVDDLHPSGIPRVDEIVNRLRRNVHIGAG